MKKTKLFASLLACKPNEYERWIKEKINEGIDGFHLDFIDPSFANFVGMDLRIIEYIESLNIPFDIHYMMHFNPQLAQNLINSKAEVVFFHQKKTPENFIKENKKAGIALEINEEIKLELNIEAKEYLFLNVKPGYCGQSFQENNLIQAKQMQEKGCKITSDGGITPENSKSIGFFDKLIIGSALNKHHVNEFKK